MGMCLSLACTPRGADGQLALHPVSYAQGFAGLLLVGVVEAVAGARRAAVTGAHPPVLLLVLISLCVADGAPIGGCKLHIHERKGIVRVWDGRSAYAGEGGGVVLCCAVLCCAVLCCAVLCCAVLCTLHLTE